jgi:hypothetical protein
LKNQVHPKFFPTRLERELASLRKLSARVGSDPLLVQASNGNTSIKLAFIVSIAAPESAPALAPAQAQVPVPE